MRDTASCGEDFDWSSSLLLLTAYSLMTDEQLKAAAQLILLMDGDEVAQAHAHTYGNWYEHLTDLMADELIGAEV